MNFHNLEKKSSWTTIVKLQLEFTDIVTTSCRMVTFTEVYEWFWLGDKKIYSLNDCLQILTVSFIYVKCAPCIFSNKKDEFSVSATTLMMQLITFIGADSPETGPNLINVEFDDGDSAKIPLDHIRMLPVNYPVVSE